VAALLHLRQLNSNVEDLDFNPDDFVAAREQRSDRQVRHIASRAATSSRTFWRDLMFAGDAALITHQAATSASSVAEHYANTRSRQGDARDHVPC